MITSQQMQDLEKKAADKGISVEQLMENAGKQVFSVTKEKYDLTNKHIIVFAGSGNNGGDGFVAARYFAGECPVVVLFFGKEEKLSAEAKLNYNRIKNKVNIIKVNIIKIENKNDLGKFRLQKNLDYIFIDALLGTGVKGELKEPISFGIDYFNSLPGIKVAVDIPSSLDPDSGEIHDKACEVDLIVCFHDLKVGLEKFKEKVVVVDIGLS
ncbi:MAG: NAD(P)H-hydrate epimerase [Nanoarchaeota archaeon]